MILVLCKIALFTVQFAYYMNGHITKTRKPYRDGVSFAREPCSEKSELCNLLKSDLPGITGIVQKYSPDVDLYASHELSRYDAD